jgi:hypothetical protein
MKHIKNYHQQRRSVVSIAALTVMLVGCSANPDIPLRDENRANLVKLDPGMTKAQATQAMGESNRNREIWHFQQPVQERNYQGPNGRNL